MFNNRLRFAEAIETEPMTEKRRTNLNGISTWSNNPIKAAPRMTKAQLIKCRPQMTVAKEKWRGAAISVLVRKMMAIEVNTLLDHAKASIALRVSSMGGRPIDDDPDFMVDAAESLGPLLGGGGIPLRSITEAG